jgi:hypothetical protein
VLLVEMLAEERWAAATAAATWAYLIRGTNGLVIFGILAGAAFAVARRQGWRSGKIAKLLAVGVVAAVIGSLPLILSYKFFGSMAFLKGLSDPAAWTLKMAAGRFVYKTLLLFGLPAAIWMCGGALLLRKRPGVLTADTAAMRARVVPMLVGGLIANVALFADYPLEVSYLLPAAMCFLLLLGVWLFSKSRTFAIGLLVLVLGADVLTVQLATPDKTNDAKSASIKPALTRGQLVDDTAERFRMRNCSTLDCWYAAQQADTR